MSLRGLLCVLVRTTHYGGSMTTTHETDQRRHRSNHGTAQPRHGHFLQPQLCSATMAHVLVLPSIECHRLGVQYLASKAYYVDP